MYCESRLERNVMLLLEFEESVASYCSQPITVAYERDGRSLDYTPDLLIKLTSNSYVFAEVKPAYKLRQEKTKSKFDFLTQYFRKQLGRNLVLIRDEDIDVGQQLKNLDYLYRYKKEGINHDDYEFYRSLPILITPEIFKEFESSDDNAVFHTFLKLVAHRYYRFDVAKPLNSQKFLAQRPVI